MSRHPLTDPREIEPRGVVARRVRHRGRAAVELTEDRGTPVDGHHALALVRECEMGDGTVHVRVAGSPAPDAEEEMRGFVGLAFHVQPGLQAFEAFYLRPTNGRADDQLRRNHSTQYISHPDHPWHRLRQEHPGVYESYVDLEPDAWTDLTIRVAGLRAELTVHRSDHLKLGHQSGGVALWIGPGTVAHFADLRVSPAGRG